MDLVLSQIVCARVCGNSLDLKCFSKERLYKVELMNRLNIFGLFRAEPANIRLNYWDIIVIFTILSCWKHSFKKFFFDLPL